MDIIRNTIINMLDRFPRPSEYEAMKFNKMHLECGKLYSELFGLHQRMIPNVPLRWSLEYRELYDHLRNIMVSRGIAENTVYHWFSK